MLDEYGCDWDFTPERKPLTAVLAHPIHGRLVERMIMMVNHCIFFKGYLYSLSWRDKDCAFYKPMSPEPAPACCRH